jgi:hypothetical protein
MNIRTRSLEMHGWQLAFRARGRNAQVFFRQNFEAMH